MDKKKGPGRILGIFNLFDIIVIAVAVALAAVLLLTRSGGVEQVVAQTTTVHYTIELTSMANGSAGLIAPGDPLVDKVKKYNIGTVTDVEVTDTETLTNDLENGEVKLTTSPGLQTATVEVEVQAAETSSQLTADGGFVLRVGQSVSVRGPGYWGTGYIVAVERSGQ